MVAGSFAAVLLGGNSLVVECAELLLRQGHRVVGLVSGDPAVRHWGHERDVPTAGFGPGWADVVASWRYDHLFSVANLRMVPDAVLASCPGLAVNFHDALLPRGAGVHAATWAVADRVPMHGVTWHVMTGEPDAGDVLVQEEVPVHPDDTSWSLNVRCWQAGLASFGRLVDRLAGGRCPRRRGRPPYLRRGPRRRRRPGPRPGDRRRWRANPFRVE